MARLRGFGLAAFAVILAGSSTQCLIVSDKINVPPSVSIDGPTVLHRSHTPTIFKAVMSDPEQGSSTLGVRWYEGDRCPTSASDEAVPGAVPLAETAELSVTRDTFGPFCLWVIVTDRSGANALASRSFDVVNEAPIAQAVVVPDSRLGVQATIASSALPLYSELHLSGAASTDPDDDTLIYRWTITGPMGDALVPTACGASGGNVDVCLPLRVPGAYQVGLTVSDGEVQSPPVSLTVTALADRPPCVTATDPDFGLPQIVRSASEATSFQVIAIDDDGDGFPDLSGSAMGSFVWSFRRAASEPFQRFAATTLSTLSFARDAFRLGDEIEVRLEYHDRVTRDFSACGDAPTCALAAMSGCYQRVGWKVVYR